MQIAEFNPDDFNQNQQAQQDAQLLVKFYLLTQEDKAASAEAGRPIFKDIEVVDIRIPGDRSGAIVRPARPADKIRFARHYEAYKSRTDLEATEGTPLKEWTQISRSHCEELAHFNIRTLEQLANMNDNLSTQFMGINNLKRKAQEWLKLAKDQSSSRELHAELSKRDKSIEELKAQMAKMTKMVAAGKSKAKPKKKAAVKKKAPTVEE